jgi:hypothetical protein
MADISRGETFVDGQSVTGTRLNAHVDNATILPAFISAKGAGSPALSHKTIVYDGTNLIAPTLTTLFGLQLTDQAAGTPSLRSLGTTATTAAQGNLAAYLAADNSFTGITHLKHIVSTVAGSGPTIAADSTNVFATLTVTGTDLVGTISINLTSGYNADLCTISFGVAYVTTAPTIILVPSNSAAASLAGTTKFPIVNSPTVNGFKLQNSSTLTTGTLYIFNYLALGL